MNTMLQLVKTAEHSHSSVEEQFVTFTVGGQKFGISALRVKDVLRRQGLTRIPLTRPEIMGAMNLRGHIIPVIGMNVRLGTKPLAPEHIPICIVVERDGESICLMVDAVGDVLTIDLAELEGNPPSLSPGWVVMSRGIYRAKNELILILDIDRILDLS